MNEDGHIDNADFDLFVFGLMNSAGQREQVLGEVRLRPYPPTPQQGGDWNGNGRVDFDDIAGFQASLAAWACRPPGSTAAIENYLSPVPEPTSVLLTLLGVMCLAMRRARRNR